jgi:hypothetical protein
MHELTYVNILIDDVTLIFSFCEIVGGSEDLFLQLFSLDFFKKNFSLFF